MKEVIYQDLGTMAYKKCWEHQLSLFDALLRSKRSDATPEERVAESMAGWFLFVEHTPVYTLGKNGKAANILFSEQMLERIGAEFFHIERGGDVTFHGPGQIVGYPILDLEKVGIGLREYIDALEQSVIDCLKLWGIEAGRIAGASGVWIEPEGARARKICAIGVRSSRYVTMHGFAFNVSTDLRYFSYINPCGFVDKGVTSMEAELGRKVDIEQVKAELLNQLKEKLDVKIYK
jgi:lipoyl(octanoyl) transferase